MKWDSRCHAYIHRLKFNISPPYTSRLFFILTGLLFTTNVLATEPTEVEPFHDAQAEHCDQSELLAISDPQQRFEEAFECGDELFATRFNILDGVGANVGDGLRFTRVPRADKNGHNEWAFHTPARETGPNAESCTVCHIEPFEDGSGAAGLNVVRDPLHTSNTARFIQRNTPHLFGAGAIQRLAEEMTEDLRKQIRRGRKLSCVQGGIGVSVKLETKNVSFGSALVSCDGNDDVSGIEGIDRDLVVKAFNWKGKTETLREFNREASHNELGMQAVELVGYDIDGDGDGITNEFSIGDITALTVYVAAQPRPVTKVELNQLGLLELSRNEKNSIHRGKKVFDRIGCAECHRPKMVIDRPFYSEPSQTTNFVEAVFPTGLETHVEGVDPTDPIRFDLTVDLPDNIIHVQGKAVRFGTFERAANGGAIVRLYGDLKHHNMGEDLAENIDETGSGPSVWMTKELWGVGSTAPYLHDGRATTLTEAILEHGGEAQSSRDEAAKLNETDFADMIAFLENLILYKTEEE